jgi:RimJ/RimL family protein N-acetyltransferase
MPQRVNEYGQPIGEALPDWRGAARPSRTPMAGRFCRIEPLDSDRHMEELFDAYAADITGELWTYMSVGPFASLDDFQAWMTTACQSADPLFHALIDKVSGKAAGMAAYTRIVPEAGVIEVGSITYSPMMQRTPLATEAMFLMMQRAFNDLGYRRYEWKCDALNQPSCDAAARLGFLFEGIFRQATIYKRRNRDTAWFAMLDREWPVARAAFETWLDADNFDADGTQKQSLAGIMQPGLAALR